MLRAILMGLVALLLMTPAAMAAPDTTPSDTSEIMQTDTQPTQPAGVALEELDPRYVIDSSKRRVGVSFECPTCRNHRVAVNVDPPFDPGPPAGKAWQRTGVDFEDLSLSPSILVVRRDGVRQQRECWHGHIRAGRAV